MKWKLRDGGYAPNIAVSTAEKAAKEHEVPVGILLGTVECESDFRLGLTSSAGAVGPCQFLPKYAEDYYRYAGSSFDLEGWESITGMAAVYAYYAELGRKRYGYEVRTAGGSRCWRTATAEQQAGKRAGLQRRPHQGRGIHDARQRRVVRLYERRKRNGG